METWPDNSMHSPLSAVTLLILVSSVNCTFSWAVTKTTRLIRLTTNFLRLCISFSIIQSQGYHNHITAEFPQHNNTTKLPTITKFDCNLSLQRNSRLLGTPFCLLWKAGLFFRTEEKMDDRHETTDRARMLDEVLYLALQAAYCWVLF